MENWLDRLSALLFFLLDGIELLMLLLVLAAASIFTAWTILDTSLSAMKSGEWYIFLLCSGVLSALLVFLVRHIRTRRFCWLLGLFFVASCWLAYYLLNFFSRSLV